MRILVIEDEPLLARHITSALMRHGHCASAQHDGAEGLRVALSDPPDLVVLDLSLPSLDGLAVLAQLRKAGSSARVLVLTARGEVGDRVKGLKAGRTTIWRSLFPWTNSWRASRRLGGAADRRRRRIC